MTDHKSDHVPKDYEELYLHYINLPSSLCRSILRTKLPYAGEDERESLAHDVFLRLRQHHMIERYDPTKSNFGGVIYFVTRTIVANHLSRNSREPSTGLKQTSLLETNEEDNFEPGVTALDQLFTTNPCSEAQLDARAQLQRLLDYGHTCLDRNAHKRDRSLLTVITMLAAGHDVDATAAVLGVTGSTVRNWINHLRTI